MRVLCFSLFVLLFFVLSGCISAVEESVTLSFWTDRNFVGDGYKMVFVNDDYLGDLSENLDNPMCNDSGLLNYQMKKSEDLYLSVYDPEGGSIDIGVVNLFSVSSGIKIKPTKNSEIFVDRSLDDACTLVYVNWD